MSAKKVTEPVSTVVDIDSLPEPERSFIKNFMTLSLNQKLLVSHMQGVIFRCDGSLPDELEYTAIDDDRIQVSFTVGTKNMTSLR